MQVNKIIILYLLKLFCIKSGVYWLYQTKSSELFYFHNTETEILHCM